MAPIPGRTCTTVVSVVSSSSPPSSSAVSSAPGDSTVTTTTTTTCTELDEKVVRGIIVGVGLFVVVLMVVGLVFWYRRYKAKRTSDEVLMRVAASLPPFESTFGSPRNGHRVVDNIPLQILVESPSGRAVWRPSEDVRVSPSGLRTPPPVYTNSPPPVYTNNASM